MKKSFYTSLTLFALTAVIPATLTAQVNKTTLKPIDPCCGITAINKATGVVTAKTSTGKTFQFKIGRAGPVDAFAAKTGFGPVDGFQPVDGFGPVYKAGPVDGLGPVDGIGPIDGIGPVDAAKILAGLKVGQKIWADLSGRVSINNLEPCCGIIVSGISH
jgi:hypothetical protein